MASILVVFFADAAMEAAWELLESVPTRSDDVDASLQDRVDALERHLYSTQVLDG